MRSTYHRAAVYVTAVALLTAAGCGKDKETEEKNGQPKGSGAAPAAAYDSPQAVFEAAKAATAEKDWKTFAGCLTEESRDVFAGGLVMMTGMIKAFSVGFAGPEGAEEAKAKIKPLDDVLAKHGLTEEVMKKAEPKQPPGGGDPEAMTKALRAMAAPIDDRTAFIADVFAAFEKIGDSPADEMDMLANATLADVEIDGETATGTVIQRQNGQEKKEPIEFRKVDGSWRIHLTAEEFMQGGGPGPGGPPPDFPPPDFKR